MNDDDTPGTGPRRAQRTPAGPDPFYDALMRSGPGTDLADTVAELLVAMRPAWHRRAACRGIGTAAFFPERGASLDTARDLCATCTVTAACAAASRDEDHGLWAGQSPQQRRQIHSSSYRPPAA